MMHKLPLSSIAFIGLTGLASAADLPVKAAPAPIPVQTWTGCYLGGHAGYGKEESKDQYTFDQTYFVVSTPLNNSYSNKGFAGGGQVGCQLQTGSFLWGIEGDFSWFKNHANKSFFTQYEDRFTENHYDSSTYFSVNKSSLWSVRARFGIVTSQVYHLYATMGVGGERASYKYSDAHQCIAERPPGCTIDAPSITITADGNIGIRSVGLVFGAGAEWKILPNVILRAEYLHYAIASNTDLPLNNSTNAGIVTGPGLGDHVHMGDVDVVRVGASWLFNFGR